MRDSPEPSIPFTDDLNQLIEALLRNLIATASGDLAQASDQVGAITTAITHRIAAEVAADRKRRRESARAENRAAWRVRQQSAESRVREQPTRAERRAANQAKFYGQRQEEAARRAAQKQAELDRLADIRRHRRAEGQAEHVAHLIQHGWPESQARTLVYGG